jgi:hypothetical protein
MSKPPVSIFSNAAKLMLLGSYATGSVVSSSVGTTPPPIPPTEANSGASSVETEARP